MQGILKTCTYRKQQVFGLIVFLFLFITVSAQPSIVDENNRDGNPESEWNIDGSGDATIQGFATQISVNKGETVYFKIKSEAAYSIDIYRLGYYRGFGAHKKGTGVITAPFPQVQPPPFEDASTGLVDCGTWNVSAHWAVPSDAVSGFYIAVLKRNDNPSRRSHIVFIVRDDASTSDIFFQASDATWQAYNRYGGNSLYDGVTSWPAGRAVKVSYNRPFATRGSSSEDFLFNAEYPMIRFLERNGYDVSYTTNLDMDRDGSKILQHKIFMSVGHDEYWSANQRAAVETARAAGVHLAFFSGNEVYWKTRWENSYDGSNTPYRTLVCYKEGTMGELQCNSNCDPSNEWTGLWRNPQGLAEGGGKPENALSGQISWDGETHRIEVPAKYKNLRFWRNTSVASLSAESVKAMPVGTLGYEWNYEQEEYRTSNPLGRFTLSSVTYGIKTHKMSLYRDPVSRALVFGAGTVQWTWGLDDEHDRHPGGTTVDIDMQQATVNLLADMGAQPASLMAGLTPATESTDIQAPITIISNPLNGATIPQGSPVTISGTITDDGVAAAVVISVDNGATWTSIETNGSTWSYTWVPPTQGSVVIKVRGIDDSGNIEAEGTSPQANAITVTVGEPLPPVCPCTLFEPSSAPVQTNLKDNAMGIETGMKFRTLVDGYISGVRFWKSTNSTGVHVGTLWTLSGTQLAQVTFSGESASGWQEALFDTPVPVTAGTTYVVSHFSPTGYYAVTEPFFLTEYMKAPLVGISTTHPDGGNGVYRYTNSPAFPNQVNTSDNYYVDVVFQLDAGPDVVAPQIERTRPVDDGTNFAVNGAPFVIFDEVLDPATINSSTVQLLNAANNPVTGVVSYDNGLKKVIFTPSSPLAYSSEYTLRIVGGGSGIKDLGGNALAADALISFSTVDPPAASPGTGPGGPILVIHSAANPFSLYTTEILRAEGLNEFSVMDIASVDASVLEDYDVVILGEVAVSGAQATMFSDFVNAGGTFIAFKPDSDLETLLGITSAGGSTSDKYLLINTAHAYGAGLVNETIQFHSSANHYNLNGALSLATLYSNATTATSFPAVTLNEVGANGGKAIAFAYDLPRSIVYTRQGNPAWAGQERDGEAGPIRSNDMFFGTGGDADWIDFSKVAIPQADEQQRLLANIIIKGNLHKKPLPKFWFLPQGFKAAVIMTGDDHANNGTGGRFDHYMTLGPNTQQDVKDWKAVRGSSYIFSTTPLSVEDALMYEDLGFEIALHPTTDCNNWSSEAELQGIFDTEFNAFASAYPELLSPITNRTHCMPWSDWSSMAKVSAQKGIRMDVNYYYWPDTWIQNRPGMFTGSGMPMRFAELDGTMLDIYQAPTQMTDESGIVYNSFIAALLDKAMGPEGYFGVFVANMHTDSAQHIGASTIIAAAQSRGVPVVSARQMTNWLDGRNGSSFSNITWNSNELGFTINALINAYKMQAMLPLFTEDGMLSSITRDGNPASFTVQSIRGTQYAFFDATNGDYVATYLPAAFAELNGTVTLQGRPAAPNAQWSVALTVDLYEEGNNTTPAYTYTVSTDENGNFTISNIPAGVYTITVKNSHTLKRVLASQALLNGPNAVDFGTLLEGDASGDNIINSLDLGQLLATYLKALGDPSFITNADFNEDGVVNALDLGLLLSNYFTAGENP